MLRTRLPLPRGDVRYKNARFLIHLSGLVFLSFIISCNHKPPLFEKISSRHSGINFNNTIIENDSINPLDVVNVYNGGGVGIGDFNNDGLQDIYFSGNMVSGKLYVNKGDFKFEDITAKAGVDGMGRWGRGVAIIDINNDGLTDIYLLNTIYRDSLRRRNILYINQGADKDGVPHFKDMAAEYGLDVHEQSTMSNFFDYDNDGDLDLYLTVNAATNENNPSAFNTGREKNLNPSKGRLYRNDANDALHHGVFHDVSAQAGINLSGFGHSAIVADINRDGWKDIYVANDFLSSNILYINNHNGSFSDRSKEYFKHTAYNAMGVDITDINNDGLADVFELDMSPPDNYRRKMMLNANNYNTIQNFVAYGYQLQYVRNMLQLNQGPRLMENDSIGPPVFSEVGFMSGAALTDWSWSPLIADLNNDAYRDLLVTNGFPKDVSDHDFIAYREGSRGMTSKEELIKSIPEVKLHNYAFKNTGGFEFNDVTESWGFETPSFSNGAAYADFDNDGDLDIVINNVNDEAFLYKNNSRQVNDTSANYLQVKLEGSPGNRSGFGAFVSIFYGGGKKQFYEYTPYRGYLSTYQDIAHFGLGKSASVDSVIVRWNATRVSTIRNVKANQKLVIKIADADGQAAPDKLETIDSTALFRDVTRSSELIYRHRDFDFIDFNIQTTLPHKLSEYCPSLVAGDINGDGLDDLIIGGNFDFRSRVFLQQKNGTFFQRNMLPNDPVTKEYKDGGLLLLDVNGDGSLDLYATGAGYKFAPNSPNYGDRLYINDGKGNFSLAANALAQNFVSKLCVRAFDYNQDGKPDLFVSGRVDPWQYPKPVSSFIYRNDSQNGVAKFTDVTAQVAPDLQDIGMVCDALFTDFNDDGNIDLLLAGEWMPLVFLKNQGGRFVNVTSSSGISNQKGWWNSIAAGDFRHTGRTDYIVGNTGLNTLYRADSVHPVFITGKDFGNNGGYEAIPSLFFPAPDGSYKEFPAHGRDDIIDKLPSLKKRFNSYHSFATATMDELLTDDQRKGALRLSVTNSASCFLRNDGKGKFTLFPLPAMAQTSALNGMITDDFDGDGNLDVLINGNDFGTDVSVGRYDALNGLLLRGDGKGGFFPLSILQSGIYVPGNGKALVKLRTASGNYLVAASQNQDSLKLFQLRKKMDFFNANPDDVYAMISFKNGLREKVEFYNGSSFLSQSSKFISVSSQVTNILVTDSKGKKRLINFDTDK